VPNLSIKLYHRYACIEKNHNIGSLGTYIPCGLGGPLYTKAKNLTQSKVKNKNKARHQWLMPIILTTQEAEIRRITV
jgi:hypothetical protein